MLPCFKNKTSEIICLVYKKFQKPEKFNLKFIFDGLHYGVSDFDYVAQATVCELSLTSFWYALVLQLFTDFLNSLTIDCGRGHVITGPVMGSICIWLGWSLDWFDYTHGVAHGCRHLEVIMFIILFSFIYGPEIYLFSLFYFIINLLCCYVTVDM